MIMTMIVVNINDVKAKLSEYLEAVARGERVLICKRNRPVAELRAVAAAPAEPRKVGGAAGRLTVPPAFFDPLPDEAVGPFYGASEERSGAPRVAEPSGPHTTGRRARGKSRR
jgi:prevent-host-death family protein